MKFQDLARISFFFFFFFFLNLLMCLFLFKIYWNRTHLDALFMTLSEMLFVDRVRLQYNKIFSHIKQPKKLFLQKRRY